MNNKLTYKNSSQSSNEKKIDINSGSAYWSIEGDSVQFTWFDVPANTSFSTHKHDNEQITYVLEGELFFRSENSIYKLSAGDCILIPANIDHEAWTAAMPAKAIDAWSPVNKHFTTNEPLNT
ncbi:MAG TPA: cupin domain-containing protein [Chitinophagaceae bacterium]|jgi:quercetin dioxygenase-like cupin family protein|nr:cupin domain-containing protein [Chitinophagaceae bacterium]